MEANLRSGTWFLKSLLLAKNHWIPQISSIPNDFKFKNIKNTEKRRPGNLWECQKHYKFTSEGSWKPIGGREHVFKKAYFLAKNHRFPQIFSKFLMATKKLVKRSKFAPNQVSILTKYHWDRPKSIGFMAKSVFSKVWPYWNDLSWFIFIYSQTKRFSSKLLVST